MYSGRIQGVGLSFRLALGECCHRLLLPGSLSSTKDVVLFALIPLRQRKAQSCNNVRTSLPLENRSWVMSIGSYVCRLHDG